MQYNPNLQAARISRFKYRELLQILKNNVYEIFKTLCFGESGIKGEVGILITELKFN